MSMPAHSPSPMHDASQTAWLHVLETDDLDEHAGAQPNWSLHYDQISHGSFAGKLTHVQLPDLRVVLESSTCALRQRGHIGQRQYGFAMALDQPGDAYFNGQRLDSESMMIGRSEDLDLSSPADFSMVAVVVDHALLNSLWERMYQKPLTAWLDHQLVVKMRPEVAQALRAAHLDLLSRITASPQVLADAGAVRQMRDAILIEWIAAIPAKVDISGLKSSTARKRVVDRACEAMLSQPDQPPTILQVCSHIGASPRKLEYCFRDVLGISPVKYLRAVRLNGVRRGLKRSAGSGVCVQDMAAHWGFWHLGDFSADYKRQFGELPSETLRRARDEQSAPTGSASPFLPGRA
ncbi:helix-turn-helix domain-containing protein [Aquabacterium sp.]|uniref:helix-turn-helix domain-containing protein n=1 Tax=Aquabacterium sp. TaxID=1872578 RepID=UPI002C72727D|nr:helix-turn-helix domain-containing protein [Aquabacterium sp.]HSW07311.1 helix-turn-helix domain-containing protein [Aquabacterium sp.]